MDFDLSEEQRLLKESVDGLLTDAYDFEQRKTYMKEKGGWSKAVWGKLAEQGLLGLPFTEVDGEKFVVINGENADTLIVTARTKGDQRDRSGIGVFLVPGNAKGVVKKSYPTQDGLHAADISFTGVEVGGDAAIGDGENALPLIERVVDEARTAMCAEAVGAMDESLKTTVEYLKTRKQFGVPIGSFQTLQHRAADMFVAVEQARSMSMFATMASDFDDAKERATAVAAAKVQIGKSLKFVGQQSIQLHGGIGMTMEAKIGHYFKRLTMIENTFGDTDYNLRRVTEGGGLV